MGLGAAVIALVVMEGVANAAVVVGAGVGAGLGVVVIALVVVVLTVGFVVAWVFVPDVVVGAVVVVAAVFVV